MLWKKRRRDFTMRVSELKKSIKRCSSRGVRFRSNWTVLKIK